MQSRQADEGTAEGGYVCRVTCPEDQEEVRRLFQEVFGEPMSQAFWQWKYGRTESKGAVVLKAGKIVAHYGGLGRWVLRAGARCLAVQIADVMVAPEVRHSVRTNSPFFRVFTTFAEHYLGLNKLFPFAFGFPNVRAYRIAERLGLYSKVGSMSEVRWTAQKNPRLTSLGHRIVCLEHEPDLFRVKGSVERLWREMSHDLCDGIVGVRDVAWLQYRYYQHPEKDYELFLVLDRLVCGPVAVIVLQEQEDHLLWVDFVGSTRNLKVTTKVLRDLAQRRGKSEVRTWCSTHRSPMFRKVGGAITELPITIPTNIWTPGPSAEALRDRWWLMPGDTDFQ